jgi:hypothetical protein
MQCKLVKLSKKLNIVLLNIFMVNQDEKLIAFLALSQRFGH